MANVKSNFQKVLDDCYKIYENFGYERVIRHVEVQQSINDPLYKDVVDKRCDACDNTMPSLDGVCLICGQRVRDIPRKGTRPNYFEVKSQGWNAELQREEIQINCGENGMLMIVKTDEGFVVDAYDVDGDNLDTMAVWEDDINPLTDDDDQSPYEDGQPRDEDGILTICPVCDSICTRKDHDFPKTMRNCISCMSEWNINDEVTFNSREGLEKDKPFDPANLDLTELEDFKDEWGQFSDEIEAALDLPIGEDNDDVIMLDYFWDARSRKWFPKISSMYTEREQAIADYIKSQL